MALTADRNTEMKDGDLLPFPVASGANIHAGAIVATKAGYALQGQADTALTYQGRAEEAVDNSAGNDGDQTVLVRRGKAFKWANSGSDPVAQADVGNTVYIEDDETIAKTDGSGTLSAAGKLVAVESDGVWVE